MRKFIFIFSGFVFFITCLRAQEINSRVKIIDNQLPSTVDRKIFRTLESALTNFINKRKWANDNFQPNEKINCQFLITITKNPDLNTYSGTLTVQVARPVYHAA